MNNDWEFDYQSQYQRSYTQPVQEMQPMQFQQEPLRKHGAKKFFKSLGIVALCGVVGFGGGVAGSLITKGNGSSVVFQAVDNGRNEGAPTSTGTALTTSQIVAKAAPAVVEITTEQMQTDSYLFGQRVISGAGSGVVISADGYVVTNSHVVQGATNVKVKLNDGTEYDATIVGADSRTDIALLKVEATGLASATIGNSDNINVGEFVLAIGNPLGSLGGTVTNGIISAVNRDIVVQGQTMSLIQTNAAVSPGNSGGGLFNEKAELIGIVNAKSADTESEGIGFAIPVNTAMEVALSIKENGYVAGRPALGIEVLAIEDIQTAMQYGVGSLGVYIQKVSSAGAKAAGLEPGDRIVSVNGNIVNAFADVSNALTETQVGDTIEIQVERNRQLVSLQLVLGEMGK